MLFIQEFNVNLKRNLDFELRKWTEIIEMGDNVPDSWSLIRDNAETYKKYFELKVLMQRNSENLPVFDGDEFQREKEELKTLMRERNQLQVKLNQKYENFIIYVDERVQQRSVRDVDTSATDLEVRLNYLDEVLNLQRGLRLQRIQKFVKFQADESFVSDQCVICMEDFEIGRNMMCLDCDGQHTFCQVCIEGWFNDHKTCPTCRHAF